MPNWCSNTLIVTGPKDELDQFVSITQNPASEDPDAQQYTIASRFLPFPKELEKTEIFTLDDGTVRTYGVLTEDGWKWQQDNWGVKWGDCHTTLTDREDHRAIYKFDTPWGPMLPAIRNISLMFPHLMFVMTWDESGMCFMGAATITNGKSLYEKEISDGDYPSVTDWDDPDAMDYFMGECEEKLLALFGEALLASGI